MRDATVKNLIEAALLAAGRPLDVEQLRELFDEFERPAADVVGAALEALAADYADRAIELKEVASGFRVQVRDSVAPAVSRLWQERPQKYSRALLETLALIAYRQPVTRGEIEDIRGVQVNPNIIRTLLERGWVRVIGHRDVPGRPELLATTREFLDYFGLKTLDDLPTLAQLRDFETLGVQLEFEDANATAAAAAASGESDAADAFEANGSKLPAAGAEAAGEAGGDAAAPVAARAPGD
ncbi:MAG TPA: SMC-Scp complex subunit ScpB [Steroidobacteraceae bacterium]|nr:SMC-Scp complex subunit ScpB [Steroidobacteraceae bacterium]